MPRTDIDVDPDEVRVDSDPIEIASIDPEPIEIDSIDLEPIEIEAVAEPVRPHLDGGPSGGVGQRLNLTCPTTGAAVATVACAGPEDIHQAVDSAARCWALWRGTPFRERGRRLRRLAELIRQRRHEVARLITREQGKPYLEALTLEVIPALDHLRFIIDHAERYQAGLAVEPRHPFYAHKRAHYLYDPIGVAAIVTPASLPFAIPLIQVASALAMGNAVVLKPSERTPLSGLLVGELCSEAGFPAGLVNVMPAVPENTMHLVLHHKVDKVFVTGSLEVGQSIMAMAGCAVRPVVLSLGCNHASIVAGEADLERAARGIVWGALANAGQNCGSIQRVFVVESVASAFMERLLEQVDRILVGDPLDPDTEVGPLLSPERRRAVHRKVLEAVDGGAKLLRGGKIPDGPGLFYPPTVLLDPPSDGSLMREETLGPLIPVIVTESLERAIMLANETQYALSASGWTRSSDEAERMMVGLQGGVVTINDVLYSFGEPASSWSGYNKSGIGQNHGTPGLREMSRQRFVSFDAAALEAPLFAFPYGEQARRVAEASVRYLHARNWFRKLIATVRLLTLKRFRRRSPVRGILGGPRRQL